MNWQCFKISIFTDEANLFHSVDCWKISRPSALHYRYLQGGLPSKSSACASLQTAQYAAAGVNMTAMQASSTARNPQQFSPVPWASTPTVRGGFSWSLVKEKQIKFTELHFPDSIIEINGRYSWEVYLQTHAIPLFVLYWWYMYLD